MRSNVRRCAHESFTVWRCRGCASIHSISPPHLAAYYRLYPVFEQRLDYPMRCAFTTRLRFLKRVGLRAGARVLDYGCATGLFVDFLRRRGYMASGYDPNVDRYCDTPLDDGTWDAIVCYDVIEHDDDPAGLLRRLTRLLVPNGLLVIGTPDAARIDLTDLESFAFELHQPYHVHILSEAALRSTAAAAGLSFKGIRPRFCFDTIFPFVNAQFIWRYVRACDNTLDATLDIPRPGVLAAHPTLLAWAFLGYLWPHRGSLVMAFEKQQPEESRL